jgi:hypothetical protein
MKLKIADELSALPKIKISLIQELQGNLKDLSEINYKKLLSRLQKKGFLYPLYLWFDSKKVPYTLDGKQRHRVIEKEYGADTMLPYIEVKAANKTEAKKEILAISSDYGTVTKDGFDEFTADFAEIDFEEIHLETTFDNWMDKENEQEDKSDKIKSKIIVEVECKNEKEQEKLYNELIKRKFTCRLLTL